MDKALFITDFGHELDVLSEKDGKEHHWKMPRYGVWAEQGRGKPEVVETSNDLNALTLKYGALPVHKIGASVETVSNYGDPFADEMEEFIKEKQESPQVEMEDKLEQIDQLPEELKKESPQEKLELKLEKEGSENPEIKDISPQEKLETRLEKETTAASNNAIASISRIASEVAGAGNTDLAHRILIAAGLDVVEMLQDLLMREYEQRDLYESYDYLMLGPEAIAIQEHLQEHLDQEMEHIRVLHRYLTHVNVRPTLERLPVPNITPLSLQGILSKDLELEKAAVEKYTSAIHRLEELPEWTSLRVDLENILSEEQEHVHDIERWLKDYADVKP